MKTIFTIAALYILAFASCKKAEYSPQPQPLIQNLTYDQRTDSVRFDTWYTPNLTDWQTCMFSGDSIVISFDFTRKPDHAKRYKIVYSPAADDEVRIYGEATYKSYGFYSEDAPAQYLDVSLDGTKVRITGNGIQLFEFNHIYGNIGYATASFDLVDSKVK